MEKKYWKSQGILSARKSGNPDKANFLIKTTQDFNSSRHAAPHLPIVLTNNIILYFNYKLFVLHLFKRSCNGTSWGEGCIVTRIFLLNPGIFTRF